MLVRIMSASGNALFIGILALGVYGGVFVMHNMLGVKIDDGGFVMEILQYILIIGILLVIVGGAGLIIGSRRSSG